MRTRILQLGSLLLCLTIGGGAFAASHRSSGKAKGSKTTKVSTSTKKGKTKTSRSRRVASSPARPPRQSSPTPERYREIQQALVDKGFHPGPADGEWGTDWVDALKSFQAAQNLNPDGKLGALSLIALGLGPNRETMSQLVGKPESSN